MNDEELILRELVRRSKIKLPDLREHLFDKQKEIEADKNRFVAALCTRRAGKSHFAAAKLLISALKHERSINPYIAITRQSAKNIMLPALEELNRMYKIGCTFRHSSLTVGLPNGSEIFLVGADTANFIERLRGPKYPIAIIDEAQSFRKHIKQLVDDVLTAAVADYNGQIFLLGTPGPTTSGYFYDATNGKHGFSVHKWGVLDNPFMPNSSDFIESLLKQKGWTRNNPTFLREWRGIWVEDLDSLVYKFRKDRNVCAAKPEGHEWYRILGVDYGFHDHTAFAILAYSSTHPHVFIEKVFGYPELIPQRTSEIIRALLRQYKPIKIVADTGGLGKSITEEMIRRYSIPMKPAQKTEKQTNIALMNGDFIDGRLFVLDSENDLMDQYLKLDKDDKGLENPSAPNDLCDAVLYAYREARGYSAIEPIPTPKTKEEKWQREEKKIMEQEEAALEKQERQEWWES